MMATARAALAILAVLALGALMGALNAAPAQAARSASKIERQGIDRSLSRTARGARCTKIVVSTVESDFARLTLTNRRGCAAGDGFALYERTGRLRWRQRASGPIERGVPCFEDYLEITSARVLRDLNICG